MILENKYEVLERLSEVFDNTYDIYQNIYNDSVADEENRKILLQNISKTIVNLRKMKQAITETSKKKRADN